MARRAASLFMLAALGLAACSGGKADRGGDGHIKKAGKISVFDLQVGDCLMPGDALGGEIGDIEGVPCDKPHTHEVFALPDYDGGDVYPGEDKLKAFANAQCLEAFEQYTGGDYLESKLFFSYLQPSVKSWQNGKDRRIVCVIVATGTPVEGSAKGTGTPATPGGTATPGATATPTSTTAKPSS
jgi:hypothetical protein